MPKVIWSRNALSDVHRLYRFLAGKNPDAARRAAKTIRQSVKLIAAHPDAGRHPDGMEPDYRELIIGFGDSGYVALYRCDGDACVILAGPLGASGSIVPFVSGCSRINYACFIPHLRMEQWNHWHPEKGSVCKSDKRVNSAVFRLSSSASLR